MSRPAEVWYREDTGEARHVYTGVSWPCFFLLWLWYDHKRMWAWAVLSFAVDAVIWWLGFGILGHLVVAAAFASTANYRWAEHLKERGYGPARSQVAVTVPKRAGIGLYGTPILTLAGLVLVLLVYPAAQTQRTSTEPNVQGGRTPSRMDRQIERFMVEAAKLPGFSEALESLKDLSSQDRFAAMQAFARRGALRLPDSAAVQRVELMSLVLERADHVACGAIWTGDTAAPGVATPILARLDSVEMEAWLDLSVRGLAAELEAAPPPNTVSEEEAQISMSALLALVAEESPEDMALIRAAFAGEGDEADRCAAARRFHATILRLPEQHRNVLARAILQP